MVIIGHKYSKSTFGANKVGGRQEVFVTFRVSIDPGADFTFENKLSQAYYSASNIVNIII